MAVIQVQLYAAMLAKVANAEVDWDSHNVRATLHTGAYTPDRVAHGYVADLVGELGTGGGYTAGGLAVAGRSVTTTAANGWAQVWAAATGYTVGELRRPTAGNGFVYRVAAAGVSAAGEPAWPTVLGTSVVDGGVTWTCAGRAVVSWLASPLQWAGFAAGPFRHLVLSDRSAGTAAAQPLIGVLSYGADQTGGGGPFDVVWDPAGVLAVAVP